MILPVHFVLRSERGRMLRTYEVASPGDEEPMLGALRVRDLHREADSVDARHPVTVTVLRQLQVTELPGEELPRLQNPLLLLQANTNTCRINGTNLLHLPTYKTQPKM